MTEHEQFDKLLKAYEERKKAQERIKKITTEKSKIKKDLQFRTDDDIAHFSLNSPKFMKSNPEFKYIRSHVYNRIQNHVKHVIISKYGILGFSFPGGPIMTWIHNINSRHSSDTWDGINPVKNNYITIIPDQPFHEIAQL